MSLDLFQPSPRYDHDRRSRIGTRLWENGVFAVTGLVDEDGFGLDVVLIAAGWQ